jgi:hypothetical protein
MSTLCSPFDFDKVSWNQPDFSNIKPLPEEHCKAKRRYRLFLHSKTDHEAALVRNVIEAIDSVGFVLMRR